MSAGDLAAYRAALEPWVKKAAREGKVINHVHWANGHAHVQLAPRHSGQEPPLV